VGAILTSQTGFVGLCYVQPRVGVCQRVSHHQEMTWGQPWWLLWSKELSSVEVVSATKFEGLEFSCKI